MTRLVRLGSVLAFGLLLWSCSDDSTPNSPTSASSPRRILVVTHTEGFRHSSIPIAESTISALGQRSGLFSTTFCRTADDVSRMLTRSALAGIDAIVFANTTGSLPIPDLGAVLEWIQDGHGFAGMHSASDTYHDAPAYLAMLGNAAMLAGLLGTVNGLIQCFEAVAHVNPADKATILSQGISEAMNCTFFGLLTAIPALIMFSVLNGRTQSLINDINETSVSVLNLVVNNRDKFKNLNVSAGRDEE